MSSMSSSPWDARLRDEVCWSEVATGVDCRAGSIGNGGDSDPICVEAVASGKAGNAMVARGVVGVLISAMSSFGNDKSVASMVVTAAILAVTLIARIAGHSMRFPRRQRRAP